MASTLVLALVFISDLIAFALAVAAEQRRSSARIGKDAQSNYCVYDSDIATGLGVGSFLLLMASQVLIMVVSRCLCCGRALLPGRSRAWAVVLFITCWYIFIPVHLWAPAIGLCSFDQYLMVTFLIAEVCLLAGSVRNAYHTKYRTFLSEYPPSCEMLRKGVFGAGAAFIVFTGIVSELYYISYSKANDGLSLPQNRESGIRMGSYS